MSNEGSIPSGRAPSGDLENQQLNDRATGQASGVWSGVGPKPPTVSERIEFQTASGEWIEGVIVEEGDATWNVDADPPVGGRWNIWKANVMGWRLPGSADPDLTAGKHGNPPLPAIPEPKRCKGLSEYNHTWICEAVLGTEEGEQCAHCQNLEAQIRAEDAAVEEAEWQRAKEDVIAERAAEEGQAEAYAKLLELHQGDARAVVIGVLRTLVQAGVVSEREESAIHDLVLGVVADAFERAQTLTGLPLVMFWALLADVAQAERSALRSRRLEDVKAGRA